MILKHFILLLCVCVCACVCMSYQLVQPHGWADDLEALHLLVGLADQDEVGEQQAVHIHLGEYGKK